jgi:hypothetical protein
MSVIELTNCLRAMISIQDPLSMSREEEKNLIDRTPYVSATHEEMGIVYNKLSKEIKDPLQSDLLDFLADIWAYNHAYIDSGELWKRFGYNGESQIVLINVEDRYKDVIKFQRYTKTQLMSLSNSDNPMNELSKIRLKAVNNIPPGAMLMTFHDPTKEALHGFPFDVSFFDNYEDNKAKSAKKKSFIKKRSRDFTLDD